MLNRVRLVLSVCLLLLVGGSPAMATAITLPDTGVDFPGLTAAAALEMGTVVVAVAGVYFAFLVLRKGLKWARAMC